MSRERKTVRDLCHAVVVAERAVGCEAEAEAARAALSKRIGTTLGETTAYTLLGAMHAEWESGYDEGIGDGMGK